jgi:hypothetical protein
MLEISPYRLDLAPSDCQVFYPLQDALRGRYFTSDQQVTDAVHAWPVSQNNFFFISKGIQELVTLWTVCV